MEYETYDTDATYDEMNYDEGVKGKVWRVTTELSLLPFIFLFDFFLLYLNSKGECWKENQF